MNSVASLPPAGSGMSVVTGCAELVTTVIHSHKNATAG